MVTGGVEMEVVMVYGVVVVSCGLWWWFRRWRRRVVASGVVDLIDRVKGSIFGFGRKARRKSFSVPATVVTGGRKGGEDDDDDASVVVIVVAMAVDGGKRGGDGVDRMMLHVSLLVTPSNLAISLALGINGHCGCNSCHQYKYSLISSLLKKMRNIALDMDEVQVCEGYGKVVDVYIPNRKSKAEKRFAFVHFIWVDDIDRLVGNLYTIWIARFHLHANVVRYEREGFLKVKLSYLDGLWVMIEVDNVATKQNLLKHIGVNSWFHSLQDAFHDFVSDERIVWVDIKGVPLNVWSRETFLKIGNKWGETMDIEDNFGSSFTHKRLCIKTKQPDSILKKFKVIFKGKVTMVRAKELFTWNPIFVEPKESVFILDDDSVQGDKSIPDGLHNSDEESKDDSDNDGGPETLFGENSPSNVSKGDDVANDVVKETTPLVNSQVMYSSQEVHESSNRESTTPTHSKVLNGGSILEVLEDMIRQPSARRVLWEYTSHLLDRWNGKAIVMGDFNDVRYIDERLGLVFNQSCARSFDHFITSSGLVDVKLEGISFTWAHPSAFKMSKLDRFLITEGILLLYPSIMALCLDRHLSDHRPILLREITIDFGPTPFWFYHSWFSLEGFDDMVEKAWLSFSHSDSNGMIRFKNKLQDLKIIIRRWVKDKKLQQCTARSSIKEELSVIDKDLDRGQGSDDALLKRMELMRQLHDINQIEAKDTFQKSKIKWAIEGDENTTFFHGIINKKRSQISIRGVFADGIWCTSPDSVKDTFKNHFEARFQQPKHDRFILNTSFNKRLSFDQVEEMDRGVSRDEIRRAVWNCGDNKLPGPDGYSFEFFRKY
nr:RNA-directed DNA polymerase, eukaryota [Tanacetum cinerariifolium]